MEDSSRNSFPLKTNYSTKFKFFKNKLIDLEKQTKCRKYSDHILILGYQDNISNLLKYLFYSFPKKKICIVSRYDDEATILKLLKQYKNLYFLKGEPIDPNILINAGVKNAYYLIFLCETNKSIKSKHFFEDTYNILYYRTNDYFFNNNSIIEFWNAESIRHLGYIPLSDKNESEDNEFLNPVFMSGHALYLGHLDKVIASSFNDQDEIETWLALIDCGYECLENKESQNNNNPLIISIDLPKDYEGMEFITLMKDILELDAIILGLLIQDPYEYNKLKDEGSMEKDKENKINKIVTSHKKSLRKSKSLNLKEAEFDPENHYQVIKDNSYNDKAITEFVDLNTSPFPIFITNPPPGMILVKKTKVMIMLLNPCINKFQETNDKLSADEKLLSDIVDKLQDKKRTFNGMMEIINKKNEEEVEKTIKNEQKLIKKQ